jgi:hypothetical protein
MNYCCYQALLALLQLVGDQVFVAPQCVASNPLLFLPLAATGPQEKEAGPEPISLHTLTNPPLTSSKNPRKHAFASITHPCLQYKVLRSDHHTRIRGLLSRWQGEMQEIRDLLHAGGLVQAGNLRLWRWWRGRQCCGWRDRLEFGQAHRRGQHDLIAFALPLYRERL